MPFITTTVPMELIHWGAKAYNRARFLPVIDESPETYSRPKPLGGLWTSPINSVMSFWDYLNSVDALPKPGKGPLPSFHIMLKAGSRVLSIEREADLRLLPWQDRSTKTQPDLLPRPLFKPLVAAGIDAVHLTLNGAARTESRKARYNLWGWDCETCLVLSPDALDATIPVKVPRDPDVDLVDQIPSLLSGE